MNLKLPLMTILGAGTAVALLPGSASAQDFCVGDPAGCQGTPVTAAALDTTIKAAETNGTDDRVLLGAGTFDVKPLSHTSNERLEIIGAGRGKTIVRSADAGTTVLLGGNPQSTVSAMTVKSSGDASAGLALSGTRAEDVEVDVAAAASAQGAVTAGAGASLTRVKVVANTFGNGVVTSSGRASITDSEIAAPSANGIVSAGSDVDVRRTVVRAALGAVGVAGRLTLADTLIDTRGNPAQIGLAASAEAGKSPAVTAERVTIVGSVPSPDAGAGVAAFSIKSPETATVNVRDSIVNGYGVPVRRQAENGGTANLSVDRSAYGPSANTELADRGPGTLTETAIIGASPGFVDPDGGDFRLTPGSSLVDAGTPGSVGDDAVDFDGRPRASDGDGDCARVSDVGAFELQGTKVTAVASAKANGLTAELSSAGSCIPGPGEPQASWSFDDGATATGAVVTHTFASAGRHVATLTVSDAAGNRASTTVSVDVAAPAKKPAVAALKLTKLSVTASQGSRRRISFVGFKLSVPAKVVLRFAKVGRKGRLTKLKTKVTMKGKAGVNRARTTLVPGTYKVTAVATSGGRSSKPASKTFKVARPRS